MKSTKQASRRREFLTLLGLASASSACKKTDGASESGANMRTYGERSPLEKSARELRELTKSPGTGSSRTPLQDLYGTITPSSLHYERHHSGVPAIDPSQHRLLIHGLV